VQSREHLRSYDGGAPQVVAVKLDHVEGTEHDSMVLVAQRDGVAWNFTTFPAAPTKISVGNGGDTYFTW
jgi:hypothetical protein